MKENLALLLDDSLPLILPVVVGEGGREGGRFDGREDKGKKIILSVFSIKQYQ